MIRRSRFIAYSGTWLKWKPSPPNPPPLNNKDRAWQLLVRNRIEGSPEKVYGFLVTKIAAAEEYQTGPFCSCQSQKPRIVQIGRYNNPLFLLSAFQDQLVRRAG